MAQSDLQFAFCSVSLSVPQEVYLDAVLRINGKINSFLVPAGGATVKISVDGSAHATIISDSEGNFSTALNASEVGPGLHTISAEAWASGIVACTPTTATVNVLRPGELPVRTITTYVGVAGGIILIAGIGYVLYKKVRGGG